MFQAQWFKVKHCIKERYIICYCTDLSVKRILESQERKQADKIYGRL